MLTIVMLDAQTLGTDVRFDRIAAMGSLTIYQSTNADEVVDRLRNADIAIANKTKFDQQILAQLPQLKLICVAATGTNNIDIEYAHQHNIQVKNVAGYSTHSVVQTTFALLLNLLMKVDQYDTYVKDGCYSRSSLFTHYGKSFTEIAHKTIGIIGMGAIGRQSAQVACAFGAEVVYYSTSGKNNQSEYQRVELDVLLKKSDFVFIHAPLNSQTHNLLNAINIAIMKPTALLINTGRGGIVNEEDLAAALRSNQIAGAGLDVFSREPLIDTNPLLSSDIAHKLVLTPHIAWCSIEARTKLIDEIGNNIESWQTSHN